MIRSMVTLALAALAVQASAQDGAAGQSASGPGAAPVPAERANAPQAEADPITVTGELEEQRRREEENRVVCRREVATGSVISRRTCRTVAEWREERERAAARLARFRDQLENEDTARRNRQLKSQGGY